MLCVVLFDCGRRGDLLIFLPFLSPFPIRSTSLFYTGHRGRHCAGKPFWTLRQLSYMSSGFSTPRDREADLRLHPNRTHDADVSHGRASPYPTPRWVKVFGVLAFIVIVIFAALHLAGGRMGHMAHGDMNAHAPPAEHDQHRP